MVPIDYATLTNHPLFLFRTFPLNTIHPTRQRPNALTGSQVVGVAAIDYADPTNPQCVSGVQVGGGTVECQYFPDPVLGDIVVLQLTCPANQFALQASCVSTGPGALIATTQDVGGVSCNINAPNPADPTWTGSIAATCVDLKVTGANGKVLVSLMPKLDASWSRTKFIENLKD